MNNKQKYIIAILLSFSAVLTYFIINTTAFNSKTEAFTTEVYKTSTGYGYSINYNKKLLIKQDYIPTIQNNQSFCTLQDAQKMADLVKTKLNNKENPRISLLDIKHLGIKLNCIN
ncbi:DUF4907 domain-containing protein [Mariniflexile litorale]|uniref:DUF4907 domain-containing protein n=1 Tax=Mariniflexile litorale TaxID=3045158 RepID=A0AAU7EFH1_9FLAO|nr:DUF4907 domain-containing protein [Mariniflexile sp. KMM 9835]MDQ8211708.1 DUF4907 domain-containing protein [Mariniflexile sp. KMM 9835]